MTLRKTIIACAALTFASSIAAQRTFDDIYYSLSDMTTSQQILELTEYASSDPQWANTYLQLAIACENTMVHIDPLTEIETAQYWANNAVRNLGLFDEYYKSGEAKSYADYYQNLNIPHSGKNIEDADIKSFVEQHRTTCTDFRDKSLEAYKNIEKAKTHYIACMEIYRSIVDKYRSREDALLCYDNSMKTQLTQLASNMSNCNKYFAAYKQVIKVYPIQNYRQIAELVKIDRYRLDGLTGSDFYANRVNMWDYATWANDFISEAESDILPLREKMQKAYNDKTAIDNELRLLLRKNDKSGLAENVFDYLEMSRAIDATAKEARLAAPQQKKSLLCENALRVNEAQSLLTKIGEATSAHSVMIFNDFYQDNFSGEAGLRDYVKSEQTRLNTVFQTSLQGSIEGDSPEREYGYSTAAGKVPSIPLWPTDNAQGNYRTTHVVWADGENIIVAGTKKTGNVVFVAKVDQDGKTLWFNEIQKTSNVKCLSSNGVECVVVITQNELPQAVVYNNAGKQVASFNVNEGVPAFVDRSAVSKQTIAAHNYDGQPANVALIDSMGTKKWDVTLSIVSKAERYTQSENGFLVAGTNTNKLVVSSIDISGTVTTSRSVMSDIASVDDCSQTTAGRIALIATGLDGQRQYIVLDNQGQTLFTTKSK